MILSLPWPPAKLSPNRPVYWRAKAEIKAKYRQECLAIAMKHEKPVLGTGKIALKITYCPATNHRRDLDNLLAASKVGIDALAEHWGIDDYQFDPIQIGRGEKVEFGCVKIEIIQS